MNQCEHRIEIARKLACHLEDYVAFEGEDEYYKNGLMAGCVMKFGGNGKGFFIREEKGRWHVSCLWPKDYERYEYKPEGDWSISVAVKRGFKALAKEIKRRLKTYYLGYVYEGQVLKRDLHNKGLDKTTEVCKEVHQITNYIPYRKLNDEEIRSATPGNYDYGVRTVKTRFYDGDVVMDMDLRWIPHDIGLEMLKTLVEKMKERKSK